jgi:hypothetical protein
MSINNNAVENGAVDAVKDYGVGDRYVGDEDREQMRWA